MLDELLGENTVMWLLVGGVLMLILSMSMFKGTAHLPPINKEARFGEESVADVVADFPPSAQEAEAAHPRAEFDELQKARKEVEVNQQLLKLNKASMEAQAAADKEEAQRRMNEFLKRNTPN